MWDGDDHVRTAPSGSPHSMPGQCRILLTYCLTWNLIHQATVQEPSVIKIGSFGVIFKIIFHCVTSSFMAFLLPLFHSFVDSNKKAFAVAIRISHGGSFTDLYCEGTNTVHHTITIIMLCCTRLFHYWAQDDTAVFSPFFRVHKFFDPWKLWCFQVAKETGIFIVVMALILTACENVVVCSLSWESFKSNCWKLNTQWQCAIWLDSPVRRALLFDLFFFLPNDSSKKCSTWFLPRNGPT